MNSAIFWFALSAAVIILVWFHGYYMGKGAVYHEKADDHAAEAKKHLAKLKELGRFN